MDSPLEERVRSEPVSDPKFPASWENTGILLAQALAGDKSPEIYEPVQ